MLLLLSLVLAGVLFTGRDQAALTVAGVCSAGLKRGGRRVKRVTAFQAAFLAEGAVVGGSSSPVSSGWTCA
jgi:hypothetical protein